MMGNYQYIVYPSATQAELEASRERVKREAEEFCASYRASHQGFEQDRTLGQLIHELPQGRFWGTLRFIDGYYQETPEQRRAQRDLAARYFSEAELQTLFTIITNQAILVPYGASGWPGLSHGNSILLEELVFKEDSIFGPSLDDEQKRRLFNLAFWENLPEAGPGSRRGGLVQEILTDHYQQLTTLHARQGIEIFHRNANKVHVDLHRAWFSLGMLHNGEVDRFDQFLRKIDTQRDHLGITQQQLEPLVAALAKEYIGHKPYDEVELRWDVWTQPSCFDKVQDSWLQHYLQESEHVAAVFANQLRSLEREQRSKTVFDVMTLLQRREFFYMQILAIDPRDQREQKKKWLGRQIDLSPYCEQAEIAALRAEIAAEDEKARRRGKSRRG